MPGVQTARQPYMRLFVALFIASCVLRYFFRASSLPRLRRLFPICPQTAVRLVTETEPWKRRVKRIAALPINDSTVVFLGDSRFYLSRIARRCPNLAFNLGINSDTAYGVLQRWRQAVGAGSIVIAIGVNDMICGLPPQDYIVAMAQLLDNLRAASPRTTLFVCEILPVGRFYPRARAINAGVAACNALLRALCEEKAVAWVPVPGMRDAAGYLKPGMHIDQLHWSPRGDACFCAGILGAIK